MKILIVVATQLECNDLIPIIEKEFPNREIDFLITGVGVPQTIYNYTKKLLETHYDIAINIGIAGAFPNKYKIGEVVQVTTDTFADIGIEDDEKFIPISNFSFFDANKYPFTDGKLINNYTLPNTANANAVTYNIVHGNEYSIQKTIELYNPDIETMEGAGFMYVCLQERLQFIQLRAISNIVEKRNKENWNIEIALKKLHNKTIEILKTEIFKSIL